MKEQSSTVVIAGAGPSGVVTSLFLSKYGIPHIILDKAVFPRDKICGDALSGKVVDTLRKLDENFLTELGMKKDQFLGSYGVKFAAPNGNSVNIPFAPDFSKLKSAPGFISKRIHFDHFLFQKIDRSFATVMENAEIKELKREKEKLLIFLIQDGIEKKIECKLLVGAEGDRSLVAKKLGGIAKEDKHYCAGLRAYYKGVNDFHGENFIELHFLKEALPGYFWIFPLPNGEANIGIGMLSSEVSLKKINLKKMMNDIIQFHPAMKERFSQAEIIGEIKGWGLPLGSKKRKISGDNYLLVGDAASLIDPFTGEGIGNGMLSGMMAAKQIQEAVLANRFDNAFLSSYDKKIYDALWKELKISHTLQRLSKHKWLFNFIINKAAKSRRLQNSMMMMFENVEARNRLMNPLNYLKLLFR